MVRTYATTRRHILGKITYATTGRHILGKIRTYDTTGRRILGNPRPLWAVSGPSGNARDVNA
jgi:hypothetical protein